MQRRTFLVGSAMAMPMAAAGDKVNVAIVGLGGRGGAHVNYWTSIPDANIVAVCDINQAQVERFQASIEKTAGRKPAGYEDARKLFENKDVQAVSTATPNHWHSLGAIWAMQAGKDVYGEKPASYNMFEGRQMIAAARKYNRICQIGMQSRSMPHKRKAVELLRSGAIGNVYMAKGLCFKRRTSIKRTPVEPVPKGVNWDLFLGPAPMRQFTMNRFRYNWHWFWDTGNGDIGNQGIHEMDIARWGLGRGLPRSVSSTGGKFLYDDDQETPNTQMATFDYGDAQIVFEVRGLISGGEAELQGTRQGFVGNLFFGEKGYMTLDGQSYQIFLGEDKKPADKGEAVREKGGDTVPHMANFLKAVRSRKWQDLAGDVEQGALSADLVHMANISYRLGRSLKFDAATHSFAGDPEANAMKSRPSYRAPYVVPEKV